MEERSRLGLYEAQPRARTVKPRLWPSGIKSALPYALDPARFSVLGEFTK